MQAHYISSSDVVRFNELPVLIRQMVLQYMLSTGSPMKKSIDIVEEVAAKVYNEAFASGESSATI